MNIFQSRYLKCVGLLLSAVFLVQCASMSRSIEIPKYTEKKLKNGLTVLIFKDTKLPYVSVRAAVDLGSTSDPIGKSGLTSLTAGMLERGSKNRSAMDTADAFGRLGTQLSIGSGYDFTNLSIAGLSETQAELYPLFLDVLLEPVFSNQEVERLRNEKVAQVRRGYDQPPYVSSLVFERMLFGTHPYSRTNEGSVRDLQSIRQKDVIRHYLKYFRPNMTTVVFVGDVNAAEVQKAIDRLAQWESRSSEPIILPSLEKPKGVEVLLVDRADLQQSEIRIGHVGVARNNPDFLALSVADTIMSGGFSSRLMREIRVKRGLTYGIRAGFDGRRDPGPYLISAGTRHEKVGELVSETIKQIELVYEKGITKEELAEAVGFLKGSFPRRLETTGQVAAQIVGLRLYQMDESYLRDYIKNIENLNVDTVNAAIRKHLRPKDFRVLVYAPRAKTIEQLRPLGAITVKNYRDYL